jgi:hypothetical protein
VTVESDGVDTETFIENEVVIVIEVIKRGEGEVISGDVIFKTVWTIGLVVPGGVAEDSSSVGVKAWVVVPQCCGVDRSREGLHGR